MDGYLKKPLNYIEQVGRLKEHEMVINDESEVMDHLKHISYYRLTGYAYQFKKDEDKYLEGTEFSQILKIYKFDQAFRNILRGPIEKLEIYARSQISYYFSVKRCQNEPYDGHYQEINFYDKEKYQQVMKGLETDIKHNSDSAFVKHHMQKYNGKMPLWVAVEVMSFTNLSKLYHSMWTDEQRAIAQGMKTQEKYLKNQLYCMSILRNICAHGGRLYNRDFFIPIKLGFKTLTELPDLENTKLFAYLIVLIRLLPKREDGIGLITDIDYLMKEFKDIIDYSKIGFRENYLDYLTSMVD